MGPALASGRPPGPPDAASTKLPVTARDTALVLGEIRSALTRFRRRYLKRHEPKPSDLGTRLPCAALDSPTLLGEEERDRLRLPSASKCDEDSIELLLAARSEGVVNPSIECRRLRLGYNVREPLEEGSRLV